VVAALTPALTNDAIRSFLAVLTLLLVASLIEIMRQPLAIAGSDAGDVAGDMTPAPGYRPPAHVPAPQAGYAPPVPPVPPQGRHAAPAAMPAVAPLPVRGPGQAARIAAVSATPSDQPDRQGVTWRPRPTGEPPWGPAPWPASQARHSRAARPEDRGSW
jgi:hypothetical protein